MQGWRDMAGWDTEGCEPTLDDVMSDPLLGFIMRRDGLTHDNVWAAIHLARQQLTGSELPIATNTAA